MEKNCKSCKNFFSCELSKFMPFLEVGCSDFVFAKKHDFIVIHYSGESGKFFIVGFVDSLEEGNNLIKNQPRYGSLKHRFYICGNGVDSLAFDVTNDIKDNNLLSICENVAYCLSRGEYHMLKHRYTKSKSCFDLAKKHISDACYLLENY